MEEIYNKIKEVVLDSGKILLEADRDDLGIESKEGNNNIVTKYDVLLQEKLKNELLSIVPEAKFMGEEGENTDYKDAKYLFIVDPIDGTTNFSRGLKYSSISCALLEDGKPVIGVCYNPFANELFEAKAGNGAFLNGKPIHVSDRELKNGILLSGCSPYYDDLREKSIMIHNKLSRIASDFRRFGSAVLEICTIAAGRAEVYCELKLMPWDHAAAGLILTEAGGKISTVDGKNVDYVGPTSVLASNNKEDYLKYIS